MNISMEDMGHAIMGIKDTFESSGSDQSVFNSDRDVVKDPLDELIGGIPIKLVIF